MAGPGKSEQDLVSALQGQVTINVESLNELDRIARLSQVHRTEARIALRINPDFELRSSGMKMEGGPRPFGIDAERSLPPARRRGRTACASLGFTSTGSQNLNPLALVEAERKAYELALGLRHELALDLEFVNLGGGFGIPYFDTESELDPGPIGEYLARLCARAGSELPGTRLVIELGRYLVGQAGIYVSRILWE